MGLVEAQLALDQRRPTQVQKVVAQIMGQSLWLELLRTYFFLLLKFII
jgi:hypothetical protein